MSNPTLPPSSTTASSPSPEPSKKKKRLKGFAALIGSQLNLLNGNEYFKQKYGTDSFSILLIATDDSDAAFVKINNGSVEIEGVKNKKEELKHLKPNAQVKTDMDTFVAVAFGKLKSPVKAVLTGKIKIKGVKKVLQFIKYFKIISYIIKQQKKTAQEANSSASSTQPSTSPQSSSADPK